MRVFFRSNADAYVLVYNIDTGATSTSCTFGPSDPVRVEGDCVSRPGPARSLRSRGGRSGGDGIRGRRGESRTVPGFTWYLSGRDADRADYDDELDSGQIVGDPYVGIERLNSRIIAPGAEDASDATET